MNTKWKCTDKINKCTTLPTNNNSSTKMSATFSSEHLYSTDPSLATAVSPNVSLYKTPGTKNNQAQRRHELLQAIKERRHVSMDEKRHINEVFKDEKMDENQLQNEELMDVSTASSNKRKHKKLYANKLMLSEWMMEKPFDFEEKWLMKVCWSGVRNLVVADKGKTKCFSKSGYFIRQFQSQLPGGSSSTPMRFTILDCVYQKEENTFYVFDVLVWNSYSVINSSTEFRFFFIESKFQESTDLQHICKGNEQKFVYVPHKSADICSIGETFAEYHHGIDGVLFYHSEVSYLSQVTPLVGWLKVYMLPEVLNLPVHADYQIERPETYTNFADYVQNYDKIERKRHKKKNKGIKDVEMAEVDESNESREDIDVEEESVMEN